MSDVPQELVDLVVDNLHDNPRALIRVSLVSHTWYKSTRRHLFRQVVFDVGLSFDFGHEHGSRSLRRFSLLRDILQEKPSIAYNITEVVIAGATKRSNWKQVEHIITAILARLHRTVALTLREVHWHHLSPECRDALFCILRGPDFSHLELHNFSASLSDVSSLMGVAKHLKGFSTTFTPAAGFPNSKVEKLLRPSTAMVMLRYLEIGHSLRLSELAGLLLDPDSPVKISELQQLRMTHVTDVSTTGQLLRAAGPSLEELELWAPTSREPKRVGDDINIVWMPALRSFEIRGLLYSPNVCSVPCLCDIFSVPNPHDLEQIRFLVDADNGNQTTLDWASWAELDAVLSSPLFPSIHKVDITLHLKRPTNNSLNHDALRQSMPSLMKRGILTIN